MGWECFLNKLSLILLYQNNHQQKHQFSYRVIQILRTASFKCPFNSITGMSPTPRAMSGGGCLCRNLEISMWVSTRYCDYCSGYWETKWKKYDPLPSWELLEITLHNTYTTWFQVLRRKWQEGRIFWGCWGAEIVPDYKVGGGEGLSEKVYLNKDLVRRWGSKSCDVWRKAFQATGTARSVEGTAKGVGYVGPGWKRRGLWHVPRVNWGWAEDSLYKGLRS